MNKFLESTSPDLSEQLHAADLVLLPCAATEQHGPHLPVATDALIVEGLLERVAVALENRATGPNLVILPVIRF